MNSRQEYIKQINELFGNPFCKGFSQSRTEQMKETGPPANKKPKLEIEKNGNFRKTNDDDFMWGDDLEISEVEKVETALSQMPEGTLLTQFNVSTVVQTNHSVMPKAAKTQNDSLVKKSVPLSMRNSPRTPLRRVVSSQWPSSSSFSSSQSNNALSPMVNRKVPNEASLFYNDNDPSRFEGQRLKEELDRKDGEIRILRDKMSSLQKDRDKMKREFLDKMEALKLEAEKNSSSLSKEIKSLKGQLEVKNMEIETAERRTQHLNLVNKVHPDSPNSRLRASTRPLLKESILTCECDRSQIKAKSQILPLEFIKQSIIPELLEPSQLEPIAESVRGSSNPRLFSGLVGSSRQDQCMAGPSTLKSGGEFITARSSTFSAVKRELKTPHTSITQCAALLLSSDLVDISSGKARLVISQVVDICHQILTELLKQLESASCLSNRYIERERELLQSGFRQLPMDKDYNLLSHREMYNDERGICARRALALLSVLVEASDFAAEKVLLRNSDKMDKKREEDVAGLPTQRAVTFCVSSQDSSEVLDVIKNIVRQLEKQRRTLMFQGVLAGTMDLMKNLLKTELTISVENQRVMVEILRWVVSARPGNFVIHNTLQSLLAATRCPEIISSLCHNSDTCILQVLCWQVQSAETPRKHILSDVFTQWVLTLFRGGHPRPKWLYSVPSEMSCQCRPLISKLSFFLLSEPCFVYPEATGNDKKQVEKLLTRGILLVHTLMNDDDYLMDNIDPPSIGCNEHFLHSMSAFKSDIKLDTTTCEILEMLCKQIRQPTSTTSEHHNEQLNTILTSFYSNNNGINCSGVIKYIDSM